jgi:hypothetical protein
MKADTGRLQQVLLARAPQRVPLLLPRPQPQVLQRQRAPQVAWQPL